ncbi:MULTISPECIES: SIP domain-containing protein [unclassified Microbacterium]|uniref:SIP domain-containing protein n=1 Tax=unclassified Microbacterium TaxID=2609290 RepID=UPI003017CCDA
MSDAPLASPPSHFLIAGDITDLSLLHQLVGRLPVDAYGQVFIEASDDVQIRPLPAPPGLVVHWLVDDASPLGLPRGERAAQAVMAWVSEWMPEETATHLTPYVMWIGCSTSTVMDQLYDRLGDTLDDLHLHHRSHD